MSTADFPPNGSVNTDQVGGPLNKRFETNGLSEIERPADSSVGERLVVDARGARFAVENPNEPPEPKRHLRRWFILALFLSLVIGLFVRYGLPAIHTMMTTESTDDAFVTAHRTNVGPRIPGLVTEVFVDQNDRVEPGMLLALLDRRPFAVALAQAEAALSESEAQLQQARTTAASQLAQARGNWFRRKNAREDLRRQLSALRSQVAALKAAESDEALAEVDHRRIANLFERGSATRDELDRRNNTLQVAQARVKEARAAINASRAALGLEPNNEDPLQVPSDLLEQQSLVQAAVSDIAQALAMLGIRVDEKTISNAHVFEKIMVLNVKPGEDPSLDAIIDRAPEIQVAKAGVVRNKQAVEDAKLRLAFTEIRSEIAGHIQDRSVNPGDRVAPGQTLLSIRPDYVWIVANYKETQINDIRIGQPVDIYVDAYPGRVFKGRVAGFSPGTGLSQTLLPPENATGNYVKVTQRLPIRIELTEPNPEDTPLFAGLSVRPYVQITAKPTGPGAGRRLRGVGRPRPEDVGEGPAGKAAGNQGTAAPEAHP